MNTLTINNITFTNFECDVIPEVVRNSNKFVATIEHNGVCYFHPSNVEIVPFAAFHGELVRSTNMKMYHAANAVVV